MSINASEVKIIAAKICARLLESHPGSFDDAVTDKTLQKCVEEVLVSHHRHDAVPITRQVTILLSDIRGFTALAETYSAITVMNLLNRYFACMTDIIVRHGGTIDKLMGDSVMALFGAPVSGEDDVQRAVACAVDMQRAMSEFNEQNMALDLPEIYMGIGINTGQVLAGAIGSDHHREYTVIGNEVNLASRIEAQSLRGQILISENTFRLARNYVLVGEVNHVQVKGKKQPVSLYELMGTTKPRARTVPRREIRKSPRININMPCFFYRMDGKMVEDTQLEGEVIDLSYNGMQMLSPVPLVSFSEIKLDVSLQLLGAGTTSIYARILKSERCKDGVLCSLEFSSMDQNGQQAIKRFVDSHIGAVMN